MSQRFGRPLVHRPAPVTFNLSQLEARDYRSAGTDSLASGRQRRYNSAISDFVKRLNGAVLAGRAAGLAAIAISIASAAFSAKASDTNDVTHLISWVLSNDGQLVDIPFGDVVHATTGKRVAPLNATNAIDRELIARISVAVEQTLVSLNAAGSALRNERRINEASAHVERELRRQLNELPGFSCDLPPTSAGAIQRSGYPDLRLKDKTSGRTIYVDPKLYERGSRASAFRTFYYEPKKETNKVLDDAHHLLVGIEHDGAGPGKWTLTGWELVDLSRIRVRLKAEFQGSNRDLYSAETVIASSTNRAPAAPRKP